MSHATQSTITFSDDSKMQTAVSRVCELGGFVRYETKPQTITILSTNGKQIELVRECSQIENPTPPPSDAAPVAESGSDLPPAAAK